MSPIRRDCETFQKKRAGDPEAARPSQLQPTRQETVTLTWVVWEGWGRL